MNTYNIIKNYIINNYKEREILNSDMDSFKQNFNSQNNLSLFKDIINNDDLLLRISEKSYTHALGFDKIVLFDMSKDTEFNNKVQLRLHLWNPKSLGVPMTESMHEHSFNFISTILKGKLENQIFEMRDLNNKENTELNLFLKTLENLNNEDKQFLNEQVELLEIIKLRELNSNQFTEELYDLLNLDRINQLLNNHFNPFDLTYYQGHYVSNRVRGEKKSYKHIFNKHVFLKIKDILKLKEGEYYFHPYIYPHRLHYDNSEFNSTLLITTPIPSNPQGGSLQRPTYVEGSEQSYNKIPISKEELKNKLVNLINVLEK